MDIFEGLEVELRILSENVDLMLDASYSKTSNQHPETSSFIPQRLNRI